MCQVITIFDKAGQPIGTAFHCGCRLPNGELEDHEDRIGRYEMAAQEAQMRYDELRRATKLFDPDRKFRNKIQPEFAGVENLGFRVNRIDSRRSYSHG